MSEFLGQGSRVADNPAAWPSGLGKGLQSPVRGFDSRRRLAQYCDNASNKMPYKGD
jgi:hypothetical protein